MTKVNDKNRQTMIYKYAQKIVDNMDQQSLAFYALVGMMEDLKLHTNEHLEHDIRECCSHILEENNE